MQLEKLIEKDKKLYSEYISAFVNKFNVHLQTGTSGIRHNADYLDYVKKNIFFKNIVFQGLLENSYLPFIGGSFGLFKSFRLIIDFYTFLKAL